MLLPFPQPLGFPNEMPGIADTGLTSALEPTVSSGGTGTVEGRRCDDLGNQWKDVSNWWLNQSIWKNMIVKWDHYPQVRVNS